MAVVEVWDIGDCYQKTQSRMAVDLRENHRVLYARRRNVLFVEVDASLMGICSALTIRARVIEYRRTMASLLVSLGGTPLVARAHHAKKAY